MDGLELNDDAIGKLTDEEMTVLQELGELAVKKLKVSEAISEFTEQVLASQRTMGFQAKDDPTGLHEDPEVLALVTIKERYKIGNISEQIRRIHQAGVQLAIVCGGGNILRGRDFAAVSAAIQAPTAHYMGMRATVSNGLALQDALENVGVPTRLQTAIQMEKVAEPFIRRRCIRHLEKGRVVILAAGTGSPFVTTDTAAALRAREIEADKPLMKEVKKLAQSEAKALKNIC